MTSLTRVYRFSASHRLHSPLLSDAENRQTYGKCDNPFGHGHDYVLEVTVAGEVDPSTGLVVSVPKLDRFVTAKILSRLAYRNINRDMPQFAAEEGALVPTTENLVRIIAEILTEEWPSAFSDRHCRLARVQIQETDRNGFELLLPAAQIKTHAAKRLESVIVNV